jgi:hypothetical protein
MFSLLPRRQSCSTPTVSQVRISPDNWVHDQALLDRPANVDIQMDLFYDYRTNLPLYPAIQAYFRDRQPPTLIVWGKNDKISQPTERIRTSVTCPTWSFISSTPATSPSRTRPMKSSR